MTLFFVLFQEAERAGPMLGPFTLLPQSIGAWLAIVMASIALWSIIKQKAVKAADLDGVGARVGKLETSLATMTGSVTTLTTMMQSFVAAQASMAERHGELTGDVSDCKTEAKDLRRETIGKLDKLLDEQGSQGNRLTKVETILNGRAE
jgi:hypothetical protein